VYNQVRRDFPSVSLGTVYRNIAQLCACGFLKSVGAVNGEERFDADMSEHTHLVCKKCGAISDAGLSEKLPDFREISENLGFTVHRRELTYFGLCQECAAKEQQVN
jgi:Fur family peroxide stress response transcriptional regulator